MSCWKPREPSNFDEVSFCPPGLYSGTETYTHLVGSGRDRTASQFKIKLTARQLADMGAEVPTNLISETIDVTKFVRLGQLIVC